MVQAPPDFSQLSSLPPQSLDAEEAVLGGILLDPNAIGRITDTLQPEAFYLESHEQIFRAALAVQKSGQVVDLMTVTNWLHSHKRLEQIGGQRKLAQLVECTVSAVNIDRHAALVMDKYYRRRLIAYGQEIAQLGHEDWISKESLSDQIEQKLFGKKGLLNHFKSENQRSLSQYEQIIAAVEQLELTIENPGFKLWEYQRIASKFGTSIKRLQDLWHHHLINTSDAKLESYEDIQAAANEVLEWILHGILPKEGLVLMHAPGGIGKTRLFYDWAFCVATGQPWSGMFNVTAPKRKVLLVQTDESATEIFLALDNRGFDQTQDIRFLRNWSVQNIAGLKKAVEEFEPDLILIDSLNSVSTDSLVSENDAEYARPVLALRRLSEATGKLIFLIHHSNKEGDVRGTSAIKAACSIEMKLARDPQSPSPDSTRRIFTIGKTRCYRRPAEYSMEFDPETGQWNWLGEVSKQETGDSSLPLKERIVDFLSTRRNQRFDYEEIYHEIGGGMDSVRRACCQLASDGIISRVKRGKRSVFFLKWDGSPTPPPNHRHDQQKNVIMNDHVDDRNGNDQSASVSEIHDHVITGNPISEPSLEEIQTRSHDHQQEREAQNVEPASNTVHDPVCDRIHDHSRSNAIANEKRDRKCDREFQIGDRVSYIGDDRLLFPICKEKELQILDIPTPTTARIKADSWKIDHEVPLSDLKFVREGQQPKMEDQGFSVGDRVCSEISGNSGEVTKVNTRYTYIHWDRDKNMRLPPIQYNANDLETMRIVKVSHV